MTKKSDYNHSSHHANYRTNHRSFLKFQIPQNSVEMLNFCCKGQIPWLGSKFRSLRRTVGHSYEFSCSLGHNCSNKAKLLLNNPYFTCPVFALHALNASCMHLSHYAAHII